MRLAFCVAAPLVLLACASTSPKPASDSGAAGTSGTDNQAAATQVCHYPFSPTLSAPQWICTGQAPGYALSVHASFPITRSGLKASQERAVQMAVGELVLSMQEYLTQAIEAYATKTGQGVTQDVQRITASVRRSVASVMNTKQEQIAYTTVFRAVTSPQMIRHVLVGISAQRKQDLGRVVLRKDMATNARLWQKFTRIHPAQKLAQAIIETAP